MKKVAIQKIEDYTILDYTKESKEKLEQRNIVICDRCGNSGKIKIGNTIINCK